MISILIILLLIIMVFAVSKKSSRGSGFSLIRFGYIKWILAAYIGILLLSSVLFYIWCEPDPLLTNEWSNPYDKIDRFSTMMFSGRIDQLEDQYIDGEWAFETSSDDITMDIHGHEYMVLVERKDVDDGLIEVTSHTPPHMANDFDYSHMLKKPEVVLMGSSLSIIPPEPYKIDLISFEKSMITRQFTGHTNQSQGHGFYGMEQIVYIRIPDSLKLIDPKGQVYFIDSDTRESSN